MTRPHKTLALSVDQYSTIRLALMGWGVRCENEAALMEKWAAEEADSELAGRCRANAAASRRMKADADAVLASI
jgi:hypothetical protein